MRATVTWSTVQQGQDMPAFSPTVLLPPVQKRQLEKAVPQALKSDQPHWG